ncbi:aryl-sulfate sulfotransferase [Ferrimonas pelagia]|uniref:Aryl-sulfate sulfotransferase n=2 Tax=Ferrimonas pelagia TaxID=1177826 RepID=A0ABP9ENL7_9GAMM
MMNKKLLPIAIAVGLFSATAVQGAGFPATPVVGQLGQMWVNPSGYSPLTALLESGQKNITDVHVTVHGKGKKGVDVAYPVGPKAMMRHHGIPIVGLYPDYKNQVTVTFKMDGKKYVDKYDVLTSPINNRYVDARNVTAMQEVEVVKVDKAFKDRLYLVNSHTLTQQGSDLHWSAPKGKESATLSMGSIPFEAAPMTYIVDTNGDYRWWLDQDAVYNANDIDINKRGYFMGVRKTESDKFTYVQGQRWGHFDLLGNFNSFRLPRGYQDASHEAVTMPNGDVLVRAAKTNYINSRGDKVHTVRDHILQVNRLGELVDVWVLPEIMDEYRDALLSSLDLGAVCVNVDIEQVGQTLDEMDLDAPYGDLAGVVAGRNWAHVNSISYDPSDDGIILSFRHQGTAKITRDKQVKWILAPREGWRGELAEKVLQPVDANGKPIECTIKGKCEGDFDFSYTQHTSYLSPRGTVTVLDNGDGRWHEQPAMPTDKWTRFVEYDIDEENMTVKQVWEYGKERGYDWYSPITSNVEYVPDRNTMFGFGGSVHLLEPGSRATGMINEIDYDTKEVKVEIRVKSDKKNTPHYRALFVEPAKMFGE